MSALIVVVDPPVSTLVIGAHTISAGVVQTILSGGTAGITYHLRCVATLDDIDPTVLTCPGVLTVIDEV